MTRAAHGPGVVAGLDAVAAWRSTVERDVVAEKGRVEEDLASVRARYAEARHALEAAEQQARRVDARLARIDAEETRRTREAIRAGLTADRGRVVERGRQYAVALRRRALEAAGVSGEAAPDLSAVGSLRASPAEMAQLSPAVQRALAEQTRGAERLLPYLLAAEADADPIGAAPAPIAVVASLEPGSGPPQALELVLPVPFTTYTDPGAHGAALPARLAWRVIAALSLALRDLGAEAAPVRYVDEGGNLAVQVWLGDSALRGDVKDALSAGFDRIHEEAGELRAANLELYVAWLDPEILAEEGP
jgi:hypothetical protein